MLDRPWDWSLFSWGRFMTRRVLPLLLLVTSVCWGQGLPDRDELIEKFKNESTNSEAAADLIKYFQWGGVRSIIRNMDNISYELAASYSQSLRHADLMRFRNDLNANLTKADGQYTKALYLMLLATIGRALEPAVFEPYLAETEPVRVRLAAASGTVKIQDPKRYDRFHQIADEAVIDPATGQDDFFFADIDKGNLGLYLYTKSKLSEKPGHGVIMTAVKMSENDSVDVYEMILDLRKRKYIPIMIDHAVQVGGVALLDAMSAHKRAKKFRADIDAAKPAAQAIAQYRAQFPDKKDASSIPFGPLLPPVSQLGSGSGANPGPRTFAVVKVSASGEMSLVARQSLTGAFAEDALKALSGRTLPAHENFKPVESFALIVLP